MTKWTIVVESPDVEGDSKVLKLMTTAGKLGLRYSVSSKEATPLDPNEARSRVGGLKPGLSPVADPLKRKPNYDTSFGEGCDECGSTHGDTHSSTCSHRPSARP